MDETSAYYIRRAQQEQHAALQADDARARKIHLQLACAYELRARQAESRPDAAYLQLVDAPELQDLEPLVQG